MRTTGDKVPKGKLRQLVPIYEERTVDRSLLVEGRRNLMEYFQSQGYFDAAVDFRESPMEEGKETIDYSITLNDRHSLAHVGIDGNRYFEDDIIRERLEMAPARRFGFRFGHYSQRILDRDLDSVRDLYRSNGFREVDVSAQIDNDYKGDARAPGRGSAVKEGRNGLSKVDNRRRAGATISVSAIRSAIDLG